MREYFRTLLVGTPIGLGIVALFHVTGLSDAIYRGVLWLRAVL